MSALVPRLLLSTDIARYLGWPTWKARRWLLSTGAGVLRGKRVVTTPAKLAAHWPEVFDAVAAESAGE